MIEAQPRRDAVRHEPIDQALVKVEAALLDRVAAGRKNARPRGRKPISGKIAACEQIDIVAPAVIVVAGDIAGIAVLHAPGRVGEDVPDALAASVFVNRAFDLIARGRRAPYEVGGNAPSSSAAALERGTLPAANRPTAAASNPRRGMI